MKLRRWSIAVLTCVVIFSGLATFKVLEIQQAIAFGESFPEHSETVEMSEVTTVLHRKTINVMGTVVAPKQLDITNELPGKIVSVGFQSGDWVAQGQVLLALDVTTEKANIAAAKARAELAQSVYRRTQNLKKSRAVSQESLDRAKAELTAALAEIEALNATIDKKTIRAPFDGRTGIHQFEVGQYLQSNSDITSLLGDSDTLWVDFYVPQFYPALSMDGTVGVRTIQAQRHAASMDESLPAIVMASETVLSNTHRSRRYRAAIAVNDHASAFPLVHNASVEVSVPVSAAERYFAVPSSAIQRDNLGEYLYLLTANTKEEGKAEGYRAHRQQVTVSETVEDMVLIGSNLREGDKVATAGAFKLAEGMLTYTKARPLVAGITDVEETH